MTSAHFAPSVKYGSMVTMKSRPRANSAVLFMLPMCCWSTSPQKMQARTLALPSRASYSGISSVPAVMSSGSSQAPSVPAWPL